MQRGASSIYFPIVVSAIDIPPESTWAHVNSPMTRLLQNPSFRLLVEQPENPLRPALLDLIAQETKLARAEVEAALTAHLGQEASANAQGSLDDIFPDEWEALCHPRDDHDSRDTFITRLASRPAVTSAEPSASVLAELNSLIEDVILVDRLREVRVLRAFERHTMKRDVPSNLAPRRTSCPASRSWRGLLHPAQRGGRDRLGATPAVQARAARLAARAQQAAARWRPAAVSPRYVLLHTLAHLLLRNTAFEAGYSTSALRERLYVTSRTDGPAMAGILIYTAAGDTEGTLGGLVRLGEYRAAVQPAADLSERSPVVLFRPRLLGVNRPGTRRPVAGRLPCVLAGARDQLRGREPAPGPPSRHGRRVRIFRAARPEPGSATRPETLDEGGLPQSRSGSGQPGHCGPARIRPGSLGGAVSRRAAAPGHDRQHHRPR